MAARKSNSTRKSSSRRTASGTSGRSSSRRSSKNKIDSSRLSLFLGVVFLIACIFVAVNILASGNGKAPEKKLSVKPQETSSVAVKPAPKKTEPQKTASQKTIKPAPQKQVNPVPQKSVKKEAAKVEKAPVSSVTKTTAGSPSLDTSSSSYVASAKGDSEPKSPFSIPPAKNGATLVIIIDDAGLNVEYTKRYTKLPFPITIAVLPKLAHSKDCAYVVRSAGKELILHQPMQSLNHNLNPGPGKISVDMSFSQISDIVNENLREIGPGVKGMNNHEGSEVTEDVLRIGAVLDVCLENNIYFLDSRTTANTQAPQAALERDMKIFEKAGPYIDNVVSREAMLKELYKALDFANKNGKAIIIGHVDKSANILPKLLQEMYPYLIKAGYRFATPSTL